ncbi:MAG TPA: hypothetical protein VHX37_05630 [Acidobacteriaceae bacterium]|jgi:uncharacterized protein (DUF2062 family)|nr:hypothetical protein [Acidobacteriaceae bacterium]
MQQAIDTLMLVCATFASLAFGVLLAYGFCRAIFVLLRQHAGQVAAQRARSQMVAPVSHADSV